MTTLVAVKKGKKICLASDGLSIFGSRKEQAEKHVYAEAKFISLGPNIVGMSGHHSWNLILTDYFKNKTVPLWKTPHQVFEIFNTIHIDLKTSYYLTPPSCDFLPFESSELQLLIINTCGIFEVEYSRMVRQYNKYSAIGTGEEYALGAIQAVYGMLSEAEEIAKIGIEAAAQFDRKTDLPLYTHCLELSSS